MVTVTQNPEKPVEPEVLAEAITRISKGFDALRKSGLNKKAIVVLLHDSTRVAKRDIETVLVGLENLSRNYCR